MLLNNCEIWFPKLDPNRPSKKFSKQRPTWEIQIRTTDRAQRKEWLDLNLNVKDVVPEEEGAAPYFRVNLKKKSIKANGEESEPVEVLNGNLDPVDPNSIGNGSIGNLRLFQYEYDGETGSGIATVLMGIQLVKHIVYAGSRDDEFEKSETEVITSVNKEMEDPEGDEAEETEEKSDGASVKVNTKRNPDEF